MACQVPQKDVGLLLLLLTLLHRIVVCCSRQIEFYQEKDGSFSGKVINDNSKNAKDGFLIFKELKYDEQSNTYKGQMMPPDAKLSINATLTFSGNNRLEVVGKKFFMTKVFHLARIQ